MPHGWIAGDEFGRASEFRAALPSRRERYVLDVPCSTPVRDLERRRPPRKRTGVGRRHEVPFVRADAWAAGQPASRWERIKVRDGEKGPLVVDAMTVRVRAKQEDRVGPEEQLVVIRPVGESQVDYALTNAGLEVPLADVVRAQRRRHSIEEMFAVGNGEAGLDHYEARSWVGWHHHMTLSLVACGSCAWSDANSGGGTLAITVPQARQILARLVRDTLPDLEEIARVVTRVLRRNNEARIYHWYKATGTFPPRRPRPNTS